MCNKLYCNGTYIDKIVGYRFSTRGMKMNITETRCNKCNHQINDNFINSIKTNLTL